MSKEQLRDQVLGHADEADGIEEYDNPLPGWWLGLFYFTIGWGVLYAVNYHFVQQTSSAKLYDAEVAAYTEQFPNAGKVEALTTVTPEILEAGKAVYSTNCVGCHGPELKGGVGPDLTDTTWIHGGTMADITKVINEGVPAKGMITWGPILGPEKVAQVAAFVHSSGGGQ